MNNMKVNFNVPFLNLKRQAIKLSDDITTIKDVICAQLFSSNIGDKDLKYKRFKICMKIYSSNGEVDITPDEASLILDSCTDLNVGGYGQLYNLLNGEPQL